MLSVLDHINSNTIVKSVNFDNATALDESLRSLGKFDIIILKDVLHEAAHCLSALLESLKRLCLKDEKTGRIFIVTRPKNPPLPLPEPAMGQWRKMAITREEIIRAADSVSTGFLFLLLRK